MIIAQITQDVQTLGIAVMATIMILREVKNLIPKKDTADKESVKTEIDKAFHEQEMSNRLFKVVQYQEQACVILSRIESNLKSTYDDFQKNGCPNALGASEALEKMSKLASRILNEREDENE